MWQALDREKALLHGRKLCRPSKTPPAVTAFSWGSGGEAVQSTKCFEANPRQRFGYFAASGKVTRSGERNLFRPLQRKYRPKNPALRRQDLIRHASQAVETQLLEVLQARQRAILLLP